MKWKDSCSDYPVPLLCSIVSGRSCQWDKCFSQSLLMLPLLSSLSSPSCLYSKMMLEKRDNYCFTWPSEADFTYCYYFSTILFLTVLSLCCCLRAFSSCGAQELLFSCGARVSHCTGFSRVGAWALCLSWQASVVSARGLSSFGSQTLKHRLNSWGSWAQLLPDMWYLPRSGIEPMSPALADGFFTTEPPGKPWNWF